MIETNPVVFHHSFYFKLQLFFTFLEVMYIYRIFLVYYTKFRCVSSCTENADYISLVIISIKLKNWDKKSSGKIKGKATSENKRAISITKTTVVKLLNVSGIFTINIKTYRLVNPLTINTHSSTCFICCFLSNPLILETAGIFMLW